MPWKSVVKFTARSQLLDFFREVRTHVARRNLDFTHQFGAAIDNGNQIFKVPAGVKIILAPAGKSFQLRSAEIYRRDQSNLQALFELAFFRMVHRWSVPCVRKSQNFFVQRHHVKRRRLLTPAAEWGAFACVLSKPKLPQSV